MRTQETKAWGLVRGHRKVGAEERHRVLEVGRRRTQGFDAGVRRIDLVVGRRRGSDCEVERRTGLGERRIHVAAGMDYARVRHRVAVEMDIPDVAVADSHAAAVEGSLGAVEGGIVLAADRLEEGRRSPVVVGGILGKDTGLGKVVGTPLKISVILSEEVRDLISR